MIEQIEETKDFKAKVKFKIQGVFKEDEEFLKFDTDGRYSLSVAVSYTFSKKEEMNNFFGFSGTIVQLTEALSIKLRSSWTSKLVDMSWRETKNYRLSNLDADIDRLLNDMIFYLYYQYEIDLETHLPFHEGVGYIGYSPEGKNSVSTQYKLIKQISLEDSQLDPGDGLQKFKSSLKKGIIINMNAAFASLISEEDIRMENDLMMLKHLTNKYPNYQELINK